MSVITAAADYGYPQIGYMPMPADFRYRDIFKRGRPRHNSLSRFRLKHPEMPCSRRAKIFAPFDALRGFNEAVASKEINYIRKPELSDSERELLDKKLALLHRLTFNKKAAKKNAPLISVTYFLPCADKENDAYGTGGTLESVTGICSKIDTQIARTIRAGDYSIPLDYVIDISTDLLPDSQTELP